MPSPIRQLLSQTSYDADGTTTVWDFSFASGYLDKSHVKAFYLDVNGERVDITVTLGMFIGDFQLSITPALAVGNELTIYRDTPKDAPLVNFADKASFTEVSLDLMATQAVFVAAEASDGLATAISSVAEIAAQVGIAAGFAQDAADAAVAAAASASASNASAIAAAGSAAAALASQLAAAASALAAAASAASIADGPVFSVNGRFGVVTLTAADVGLENADNTSDVNKPVSTAQAAAIAALSTAVTAGFVAKTSSTGSQLVPAGTTAERDVSPVYGAQRANSTLNQQEWWNGSDWVPMGGGASGPPGNGVFYQAAQVLLDDYTIPANTNAITGSFSIATGKTLTIGSGSTVSIV